MEAKKYVKKPIPVEAVQWTGENVDEIKEFCKDAEFGQSPDSFGQVLRIRTLEGTMTAESGSYIIRGIRGEFYPCERKIFEESYEEAK